MPPHDGGVTGDPVVGGAVEACVRPCRGRVDRRNPHALLDALRREVEEQSGVRDEDDCGVCEADVTVQTEVITGTLAGAPKVLLNCTTYDQGTPSPAVASIRPLRS